MDILDRWAKRRLETKGYLRASYRPAPGVMLGVGGVMWPGDGDTDDPETFLKYSRISNVVYACSAMRANMLAGLPLRAYKFGADGKAGRVRTIREPRDRLGFPGDVRASDAQDVTELEAGKIVDLLRRVNRWWTPRRLIHMTELSLCLAGQAFWQLDRGEKASGTPTDLYYIKHTRMQPVKDKVEIIGGWTLDPNTNGRESLEPSEVVWFRFPDPTDPDYGALPPLAAARLGADTYAAAMKSNYAIFANGLAPGGFVMPPEGQQWDEDQLDTAQEAWRQKLEGVEKRHRWLFMPEPYTVKENTMTPKDAEFLGGMDFSVEDVARAYGLPIELVGGARRTYQNLENAMRAVWMFTMEPEASFIAAELTEQLVPLFGGEVDFVAFDLSDVTALQEDEAMRWARDKEQIAAGSLTINEWRATEGKDPLPWGDVAWLPAGVQPISDATAPAPAPLMLGASGAPDLRGKAEDEATVVSTEGTDGEGRGARQNSEAWPAYGSPEHVAMWRAVVDKQEPHERKLVDLMDDLFERQMRSMLDQMGGRSQRATLADLRKMFNMGRWVREFRTAIRPHLRSILEDSGNELFGKLPGGDVFDPDAPNVVKAMIAQSHEFASTINQETWARLNRTLGEGINGGESLRDLMARVQTTMTGMTSKAPPLTWEGDTGQSRAELIARTETTRAWGDGAHQAAMQSDVVDAKKWMSAIDARTRSAHASAHGQEVAKAKPFVVGGEEGQYPGDSSFSAGNVCNCRCSVSYLTRKADPKAGPTAGDFEPGQGE